MAAALQALAQVAQVVEVQAVTQMEQRVVQVKMEQLILAAVVVVLKGKLVVVALQVVQVL